MAFLKKHKNVACLAPRAETRLDLRTALVVSIFAVWFFVVFCSSRNLQAAFLIVDSSEKFQIATERVTPIFCCYLTACSFTRSLLITRTWRRQIDGVRARARMRKSSSLICSHARRLRAFICARKFSCARFCCRSLAHAIVCCGGDDDAQWRAAARERLAPTRIYVSAKKKRGAQNGCTRLRVRRARVRSVD